eukprot:750383-Rhodomonas_salina.1
MELELRELTVVDEQSVYGLRFARTEVVSRDSTFRIVNRQSRPVVEGVKPVKERTHALLGPREKRAVIAVGQRVGGDARLMLISVRGAIEIPKERVDHQVPNQGR